MRRTPWILPCVAAAVVWLTAASTSAQQPRANGDDRATARVKAREQAARAQQQRLRGLANQLRPFYRHELMHVRTACGLSSEQLQRIRPETDAAYEEAIAGLDAARPDPPRTIRDDDPDYQEAIRKAVHSVVQRHVGRERWAALQADLRLRAASRKDAGVDLLVAVLDRELLLTGRQRREIAESVSAHWEDRFYDPLEVAFNDQSRCPRIPDELVTPSLSAAQREVWRRLPQLQGRLWGVIIDHGGSPVMEQELGGYGGRRPTALRPPLRGDLPAVPHGGQALPAPARPLAQEFVQMRVDVARPAAPQVGLVVRAPARVARPAAAQEGDDGPGEDADPAVARLQRQRLEQQMMLEQHLRSAFDRQVYGGLDGEDAARAQLESALAKRVDDLACAGGLSDRQRMKLRAAGRGDIKRFLDRCIEARQQVRVNIDQRGGLGIRQADVRSLVVERDALMKVEGPIFSRTLPKTLTDDQRIAIEKEARDRLAFRLRADVRWTVVLLARSLGLLDDQRRRLESLLLERTVPPRRFDSFDYAIVMYQAARIPEDELRPIFDDLQWRVMTEEFAAIRRWGLHLKQGGFLPDEMFGDEPGGGLPPIQMLAPPQLRR